LAGTVAPGVAQGWLAGVVESGVETFVADGGAGRVATSIAVVADVGV
jgi:hypothetical protein